MNDGIDLLQLVLSFETKDPLILSCVLTNVSALFPFVTYRPEYLPQVLSKVGTWQTVLKLVQAPCIKSYSFPGITIKEGLSFMLMMGKTEYYLRGNNVK